MITTEKIKRPVLTAFLRMQKTTGAEIPAKQVKENRITKGRRVIKRLQIISGSIMLIRMILLFSIAAVAASVLLHIF